jgi:hypothetical protein
MSLCLASEHGELPGGGRFYAFPGIFQIIFDRVVGGQAER